MIPSWSQDRFKTIFGYARRAAEEAMKDEAATLDYAQAQADLAQAAAQLAAIKKMRKLT